MKKICTLICSLALLGSLQAQLPNGSTAPNFTAVDIDGNSHTLYDYLDAGKTVVMDLSAAWCAPCWFYHTNGILEQVWEDHGPTGDNTIQVLFVESEATNTLAQITGTTTTQDRAGFTQGDWTAGVTYPIIDDASIAAAFQLQFYPTIFVIRPDRSTYMVYDFVAINNLFGGNPAFVPEYIDYISNNDQVNDIAILDESAFFFRTGCPEFNESIMVTNVGQSDVTSFDAAIISAEGETLSSVNWTGNLTPFQAAQVDFPSFTIQEDVFTDIVVSNPNGQVDSISFLNSVDSLRYSIRQTMDQVTFKIRTDFWPEETSWFILDEAGGVLASSLQLGTLSCDFPYEQTVNVPEGQCITLRLTDSFGDGLLNGPINPGQHSCGTPNGIANQAMGYIQLLSSDGDTLFNNISYGSGTDVEFHAQMQVGTNDVEDLSAINLFPNPASDKLNINFDLSNTTTLEISVYNNLGQLVHKFPATSYGAFMHQLELDVTAMPKGTYTISFTDEKGISTKRFSVN